MSAAAQLPRPGDMIAGKYVLDRLLGQGGMGAVFAAKHVKLSKAVAIKIMLADTSNPEAAQRFINEGRAAANIQNEHVVRVDDVDEEMGYAYMVLELLDGEDLSQLLERSPNHRLQPHVAVGYVLEALRGVMQAHAIGIVHRDLKPSNLFLARRKDGTSVVKVLDFGISKAQGSSALAASPSALTSTKAMLGSPLYMSPEQLRSSKSVDHRADIWAIGIILYELITSTLPFMGDNLGELFAAILETDPAPLRTRAEGVAPGLEEVVLRCLQRRPENRFQTASELLQALAPYADPRAGFSISGNAALGGTAMLGPEQAYARAPGAQTPGAQTGGSNMHVSAPMLQPPPGAITTGSGQRMVPGAPPFGAMTPQGMHHTANGGWQSTGNGLEGTKPKASKAPLVVGAISLVAVVGALGIGAAVWKSKGAAAAEGSNSAITSAPPPPALSTGIVPPTPPTPVETATTAPVETAPPAASSVAVAPSTHGPAVTTPKTTKTSTTAAKVDPPKTPDASPAPAKSVTPPKPNNGNLQNAR